MTPITQHRVGALLPPINSLYIAFQTDRHLPETLP